MSVVAGIVVAAALLPQSPAPRLAALAPAGGTRATEVEVTLRGERVGEIVALQFDEPGLEVLAVKPAADRCVATLRVAPDCRLGAHRLRARSALGLSNLLTFHVGALPSLREERQGDAAMAVPLGVTVDGALRDGEVDRYATDVPQGARVVAEVEAMRLGQVPLDVRLVVRGPDGAVVATADDTPLGRRDPWLAFDAAAAGTFTIELHGAVPAEGRDGVYRLHVGRMPRPLGASPAGGAPGAVLDVALRDGRADLAAAPRARVTLPDDGREVLWWTPELADGAAPTPIALRVGGPPNREPVADDKGKRWFDLPGSVDGVVATDGAAARFHVRGVKGEELEVRVLARSLRSALDPVLLVRGADERVLASNDDAAGMDSVVRFAPAADGEYVLEVRDLLRRGSPAHFFRLEAGPRDRSPKLSLQVARLVDPVVAVPQGGVATAIVLRQNLDDKQPLAFADLPPGVTATVGPQLPGQPVAVRFDAVADAALVGAQARGGVLGADGALDARPWQQVQALLLGRNDTPLVQLAQRTLPVAVTAPAMFALAVEAPAVPLVRGGLLRVPVRLGLPQRSDVRVRVRAVWLAPGLSAGQAQFDVGQHEVLLPIEASAGAALGTFPVALVASARVGNVVVEQALPWFDVRVEAPWAELARVEARGAQGAEVEAALAITRAQAQRGVAAATVVNLPRGVQCATAQLAADAAELRLRLQLADDAAPGKHGGLTVELQLPDDQGRPVLHRLPFGELRVDAKKRRKDAGGAATANAATANAAAGGAVDAGGGNPAATKAAPAAPAAGSTAAAPAPGDKPAAAANVAPTAPPPSAAATTPPTVTNQPAPRAGGMP